MARFGAACASCPLAAPGTTAKDGREIKISPHEKHLAQGWTDSRDPGWLTTYRATRPEVERKIAPSDAATSRGTPGSHARPSENDADFSILAAAVDLARLARLGVLGVASTRHDGRDVASSWCPAQVSRRTPAVNGYLKLCRPW
ncbi:transposase [Sphaerisporangium sp. NPDC005289]|uniref:transposase n=1 Tax=Sphaerisporangium sp. NPDC005289 TaxID=3155247 RepID=UPI0033B725D1